jgi:hypothetical protein
MAFPTELDLRQVIWIRTLVTEQGLRYMLYAMKNRYYLFFPLRDAINFQNQGNTKEVGLQLGVTECKVYQSTLTESKSKCQFEYLRQIHILDKIEDDESWECVKVLK